MTTIVQTDDSAIDRSISARSQLDRMDGDAHGEPRGFDALVAPIIQFLNHASDRTPISDWYQTETAKRVGFDARPVVGGLFMRMLHEMALHQEQTNG